MDLRGGQHPEWDSEVRFTVLKENGPGGKNRKLEVSCYCQGPKTEDLLGGATVDISDTLKTGEFDGEYCTFSDRVFAAQPILHRLGQSECRWHRAWRYLS